MSRPPYPPEFRAEMVRLVRSGRTPDELAKQFEPTAQAIRNWVKAADAEAAAGRGEGLSNEEREELKQLHPPSLVTADDPAGYVTQSSLQYTSTRRIHGLNRRAGKVRP